MAKIHSPRAELFFCRGYFFAAQLGLRSYFLVGGADFILSTSY